MRAFHKLTPDETFIFHFRNDFPEIGDRWEPEKHSTRRAITVAVVLFGEVAYTGVAPCSWQDQFVRKVGYRMALGRALRDAGEKVAPLRRTVAYPSNLEWARDVAEDINGNFRR